MWYKHSERYSVIKHINITATSAYLDKQIVFKNIWKLDRPNTKTYLLFVLEIQIIFMNISVIRRMLPIIHVHYNLLIKIIDEYCEENF